MKKFLLSLSLLLTLGTVQAQNQYMYGFNGTTADLLSAGWTRTNQSTLPSTTRLWTVPNYTPVTVSATQPANPFGDATYTTGQTSPAPLGQAGGANSFALVSFQSTTSTAATGATISNWLFSPVVTVLNGDIVSFYTRLGKYSPTNMASFPDNLQLRMSTQGAFTTDPTGGPTAVGDYTNLLVEINPTLNLTSYPASWTQYSYTIAGLTGPTDVKFAFRYYVTDGGLNGSNSDIIGIDTFSVDRSLSTNSFFAANFALYPNPADNVINISTKNNTAINKIQLTDLNGRTIKDTNLKGISNTQINIANLNTGMYLLKITSNQGVGTTKILKN